jgi:hypothetical protein
MGNSLVSIYVDAVKPIEIYIESMQFILVRHFWSRTTANQPGIDEKEFRLPLLP